MSTKKDQQRVRKRAKLKSRSRQDTQELEELVRAGVERFMLKDATIYDFLKTIRSAAKKESVSPHPLTKSVFSRIVKQASKKRKRQTSGIW